MNNRKKKYCNIPACENNRGTTDPEIRLFRVPSVTNAELRSKWMEAIKNLFGIDFKASSPRICSQHFNPNDFTPSHHLRSGVVPSIGIKSNSSSSSSSSTNTIKIEPMETLEQYPFKFVNIDGITEQANCINTMAPVKQPQHLPQKKPDYCLKCIDYDMKLQISKDKNAKLMEKLKDMANTNKRLKAQLKYAVNRGRTIGKPVKWECCQICNAKLAPNEPHLCMDVKDIACEYCSSSFKTTVELCKHLQVAKHTETIYECDKCPAIFSTATLLTFHRQSILAHTKIVPDVDEITLDQTQTNNHDIDVPLTDKIFACGMCDESFKHSLELKTHMTQIHMNRMVHLEHEPIPVDARKNRFECYICKIELPSKRDIRQHLKLHTAAQDKKCVVCTERLTANEINWHMCFSEKSIACDYCGVSFNAITKLLQHLEAAHDDRTIHKCTKCPQYFGMTILIDWHERKHNNQPKLFACEKCEKKFAAKHLLKCHLKTHDKQINFLCSECGKGCTTAHQLSVHSLVHTAKTLQCPDCPLTFNNPHLLADHREIHMNLKYKCNECNSTFACKRYLIVHKRRKHMNFSLPRKFECTECPLKFITVHKLNLHMRKHTGEKPFTCEYCEKKYAYKQDLLKHMQTHVGNNIYQCDRCDQGFRLAYDLRHHSYTHYRQEKAKSEPMPCS